MHDYILITVRPPRSGPKSSLFAYKMAGHVEEHQLRDQLESASQLAHVTSLDESLEQSRRLRERGRCRTWRWRW